MFYIKKLNPKLLMEQDEAREILHSECLFLNNLHMYPYSNDQYLYSNFKNWLYF